MVANPRELDMDKDRTRGLWPQRKSAADRNGKPMIRSWGAKLDEACLKRNNLISKRSVLYLGKRAYCGRMVQFRNSVLVEAIFSCFEKV